MSKKNRKNKQQNKQQQNLTTDTNPDSVGFSFGEPVPVLDKSYLFDYTESYLMDGIYEPRIPFDGLAKSFRANAHHSSAAYCKRNILISTIKEHPLISQDTLNRFTLDYLVFGNAYLQVVKNGLNQLVELKYLPALYMRKLEKVGEYCYKTWNTRVDYKQGQVVHLLEPDISQEIYGVPEYFGALNSVWLNESATIFRRKYYSNGAHAGFLLYMNNPQMSKTDEDNLQQALKSSRGLGNFKNMFINAKGRGDQGKPEIIPIGDINAKDEFLNIKNVSRDDILAAWRIPPALMSIIPQNTSGFGDVEKAANVFAKNEIKPLQTKLRQLNQELGVEVIKVDDYELGDKAG